MSASRALLMRSVSSSLALMPETPPITFDDFLKVDVRVGRIVEVRPFPAARKPAYQLEVDFGGEIGRRRSSAQLTQRYTADELLGRQVLASVELPTAPDRHLHVGSPGAGCARRPGQRGPRAARGRGPPWRQAVLSRWPPGTNSLRGACASSLRLSRRKGRAGGGGEAGMKGRKATAVAAERLAEQVV